MRLCSIPECGRQLRARGLCHSHYMRRLRNGTTGPEKPITTSTPAGEVERYFRDVVRPYDGDECLIWPFARVYGYGAMTHNGKSARVCPILCEEEHGPRPTPDHEAAHSCGKGNLGCVTKRHLSWKTALENSGDKLVHGTRWSKLSAGEVQKIRHLIGTSTQEEIASQFGISQGTVSLIGLGKTWSWLSEKN